MMEGLRVDHSLSSFSGCDIACNHQRVRTAGLAKLGFGSRSEGQLGAAPPERFHASAAYALRRSSDENHLTGDLHAA